MRILQTVATVATLTAVLAACGEQTEEGKPGSVAKSPSSPTSAVTTPVWAGEVIPDGTYAKTATVADAKALGMPKELYTRILGEDRQLNVELKIAGDNWVQFGDDDSDTMAQGDAGTATYDADGNWVTTSNSTGCPGCVATVKWTLQDGRLTLRLVDTTEVADPGELLIGRLVMEGEYTRR